MLWVMLLLKTKSFNPHIQYTAKQSLVDIECQVWRPLGDVVLQGEGPLYSHFMNTLGLQCQPSEHHCSFSSQEVHKHSIASSSLNWFLQRIQTLVSEFVIVLQTRGSTHLALNLMKMYIIWWANITQGVGSFWMSQHKKAKNQNFAKRDRLLLGQSNLLFFILCRLPASAFTLDLCLFSAQWQSAISWEGI